MRHWKLRSLAACLAGVGLLAGCAADDETLVLPDTAPAGGDLFARYVAMGQSNTAGFQSAGINDSTQHEAYPVLLAEQAGVEAGFHVPSLALPGCPPPLTGPQPLTSSRVGGPAVTESTCALREGPAPPYVSNVAVPGSRVVDWVDNALPDSRSNTLTTLLLGGRTQLQAMRDADPTLVSVFPEGNELLRAALGGAPALALPQGAFEAALDEVVTAIDDEGAEAVLFGVFNVLYSPALQPGAYYFALQLAGQSPKPVSADCAPGTPGASSFVAFSVLSDPAVSLVSCAPDAPGVLSTTEQAEIMAIVATYNEAVSTRAEANGWAYIDPNAVVQAALADPDKLRKCQGIPSATPATFQQAVLATCPGPQAPNFWGSYLSYDPIHFSRAAHQLFANAMADAINQAYGLSIPTR